MTTADVIVAELEATKHSQSPRQLFWARFKQDKAALVGGVIIIILILLAIFGGPLAERISGHAQNEPFGSMTDEFGIPRGPNSQFWFGADAAGRDLFVRTMYGARTSLLVGLVASGAAVLIGTTIGLLAGFFGGWADSTLSRGADVMALMGLLNRNRARITGEAVLSGRDLLSLPSDQMRDIRGKDVAMGSSREVAAGSHQDLCSRQRRDGRFSLG